MNDIPPRGRNASFISERVTDHAHAARQLGLRRTGRPNARRVCVRFSDRSTIVPPSSLSVANGTS